jgi:molybdopterin converting factor subunit 1
MFAAAREMAGASEAVVDLPGGATLADLRSALADLHPRLAPLLGRSLVAINGQYADDACELQESDEVAVIPPVSGG